MFNAREVFEIAVQTERNGQKFYNKAIEIVRDEDAKKFIRHLGDMEVDHEKFFNSLKDKYTNAENNEFPDIDNAHAAYLQAVADGNKMANLNLDENTLTGSEKLEDILKLALQFEKNTVIFFSFLKTLVPETLGKEKVDAIITEELGHVATICAKIKDLQNR